jgi:hypothetical protein
MIDGGGRRFAAEAGRETHDRLRILGDFSPERRHTPGFPVHLIFDANTLHAGPLSRFSVTERLPVVGGQQRRGQSGLGIHRRHRHRAGGTARGSARCAQRHHRRLQWRGRPGSDPEFWRPPDSMRPLADGPLYAIQLMPGVATTAGGPRRDEQARVLGQSGKPIGGLYAVGDTGSIWGHIVEHGCALTDGLVFARIAAAHALGQGCRAQRHDREHSERARRSAHSAPLIPRSAARSRHPEPRRDLTLQSVLPVTNRLSITSGPSGARFAPVSGAGSDTKIGARHVRKPKAGRACRFGAFVARRPAR